MKNKYIGGWSVNNGSSYSDDYEYTSLREARTSLRAMALGNVYPGNTGSWYVNDINAADPNDHVASGRV